MIIFLSQHFQIIEYYRHPSWVLTNTLDRPSVNTHSTSRSTLIQHLHRYYICCHLIDILVITVSRQSTNFYRHAFQCPLMHESVNTDSQLSTNSPSSVLSVIVRENRAGSKDRGRPFTFIFSQYKSYTKRLTTVTFAEVGVHFSSRSRHIVILTSQAV